MIFNFFSSSGVSLSPFLFKSFTFLSKRDKLNAALIAACALLYNLLDNLPPKLLTKYLSPSDAANSVA